MRWYLFENYVPQPRQSIPKMLYKIRRLIVSASRSVIRDSALP